MADVLAQLGGPRRTTATDPVTIEQARDEATVAAHRRLRHASFVVDQGLFDRHDRDDVDEDPRTVVLVARASDGTVVGGVRLAPCWSPDLGWWAGSRLVVAPGAGPRVGAALVRAACAHAAAAGVVRFDAGVQARYEGFFARLGWQRVAAGERFGVPHVTMRFPPERLTAAIAGKRPLGGLVGDLRPGGPGWRGDDGAPVPGTDTVAAVDAIVPAMVERDPWWAGWCGVLVNVNDLAAMGAPVVGLLDALAAPSASAARRVLAGLRDAAGAWDAPVLGGHTQLDAPAGLTVTALGRARAPVSGGGGRAGDGLHLTVDLTGGWRPGYGGRQWDSTTHREPEVLRRLHRLVAEQAPRAAKDVSMAGLAGTVGMLAEASGVGAELEVAAVPRPPGAPMADWLTCFPGFGMVTAGAGLEVGRLPVASARIGRATAGGGTRLRWPDGEVTEALPPAVTGLGPAAGSATAVAAGGSAAAPGPDRPDLHGGDPDPDDPRTAVGSGTSPGAGVGAGPPPRSGGRGRPHAHGARNEHGAGT